MSCFLTAEAQAVVMGGTFLLCFAAYDTIQVFAKRLYPHNLGINMTFAIYVFFTLSEIVSPAVVNKIGPRCAIFTGMLGYASVVLAGLIFFATGQAPWVVLLSGCVLGSGAGLLWTGQGTLMLEYTTDENRGVVFAIFWSLYRCAGLSGGLLTFTYFSSSGTSGNHGSYGLYIIFLVLVLLGACLTMTLQDPEKVILNSHSSGSARLQEPRQRVVNNNSWLHEFRETISMFFNKEMLLLSLMFWTSGGNEPYILSGFSDRYFEKRTTGMEIVWYFSLSVMGSIGSGFLLDGFSRRRKERKGACTLLVTLSLVHIAAFACAVYVEASPDWHRRYKFWERELILPSVAFCLWGLSDAMINAFLYWLIGILHTDSPTRSRAIAFFKLLNSAAHVVGYGILPVDRVPALGQLWYNVVAYCIGAVMAACVVQQIKVTSAIGDTFMGTNG